MTKQAQNLNSTDGDFNDEVSWKMLYEELEEQMHNMMVMTLELIDDELDKQEAYLLDRKFVKNNALNLSVPNNIEKEYRRLKLFEHRINVTFLGKITLKYIAFKRKLRILIKGK